jgi:hypothetical protein
LIIQHSGRRQADKDSLGTDDLEIRLNLDWRNVVRDDYTTITCIVSTYVQPKPEPSALLHRASFRPSSHSHDPRLYLAFQPPHPPSSVMLSSRSNSPATPIEPEGAVHDPSLFSEVDLADWCHSFSPKPRPRDLAWPGDHAVKPEYGAEDSAMSDAAFVCVPIG